jgi:hypothetical protein
LLAAVEIARAAPARPLLKHLPTAGTSAVLESAVEARQRRDVMKTDLIVSGARVERNAGGLSAGTGARTLLASLLLGGLLAAGCDAEGGAGATANDSARATIGPAGGDVVGAQGSALEGVRLSIPAGALSAPTEIAISPGTASMPLPVTAVRCGPMFDIQPAGLALALPATLTLPFDETTVTDNLRFDDQVKVWLAQGTQWGQALQTDSQAGSVSVQVSALGAAAAGVNPPADTDVVTFKFAPNPKFLSCLAGDPANAPDVEATVVRGDLNDGMFIRGGSIKPGLAFDMFTVQNSSLTAAGTPDPAFTNFGLAWYQSDLQANSKGVIKAQIRTILLDQIFGFDPTVTLPPTGTFQVGFWFNNPADAAACGFDVTKPTPFNGEHQAGPLAMITLPDATTGLGPLCTKPDTSVTPARCSP